MTHSVSLVGVGVLGKAISLRLLRRHFSLSVFNRTRSKTNEVAAEGAHAVPELHQLFTQEKQIVLICLKDAGAIREVFQSEEVTQRLARYRPLLLNISTIGPEESRWMETFFHQHGAHYVECPVSGGPEGARQGKLAAWVGPCVDSFASVVNDVITSLSDRYVLMANNHSAQTMKVINNYCEAVHLLVAAEALLVAEGHGIAPDVLAKALTLGRGRSTYMEVMLDRYLNPRETVSVPLSIRLKDLDLANTLFQRSAIHSEFFDTARQLYQNTADLSAVPQDQTACFSYLSRTSPTGRD
ncbi:NAD(P)-dependent oxidoreductase [Pectobacterium punjabense]|uniref:NAD(P)-dependent oxidoreductase n=1 Tax=Pectobacterium punjabense TaxID=2108399 RepID=A0ABX6KY24_9GAMM|nr:NAD(P)-dependent oxidoreductase [Pectobacterium punjabense]MBS4432785.1 NAD(P)-dependent oxidoreductase [Pectobacterium punjabense]PTA63320.1 NAD(P)-dependent oxidoreductase [Pectobacterium punjabense]QJA18963.1 NAD(P)-dependent oxidoreductase [Pectobacterium punjabense]